MFKDLEELHINDCQTDICLVGAGGVKVFIHRTMLTSTLKRMTLGYIEYRQSIGVSQDLAWCS